MVQPSAMPFGAPAAPHGPSCQVSMLLSRCSMASATCGSEDQVSPSVDRQAERPTAPSDAPEAEVPRTMTPAGMGTSAYTLPIGPSGTAALCQSMPFLVVATATSSKPGSRGIAAPHGIAVRAVTWPRNLGSSVLGAHATPSADDHRRRRSEPGSGSQPSARYPNGPPMR